MRTSKKDRLSWISTKMFLQGTSSLPNCIDENDKRLLLLSSLKAAERQKRLQPEIVLNRDIALRSRLRKYKRGGQLMTASVSETDKKLILQVFADSPQGLLNEKDS